jgi:hypothetical protein
MPNPDVPCQMVERSNLVEERNLGGPSSTMVSFRCGKGGRHHGVSPQHLQACLNEFTFRINRRFYPFNAFRSRLGIGHGQ